MLASLQSIITRGGKTALRGLKFQTDLPIRLLKTAKLEEIATTPENDIPLPRKNTEVRAPGTVIFRPHPFLAQLIPVAAPVLQWMLWPLVRPLYWFLFYPAVFAASWTGGLWGGLAAVLSSTLIVLYVFVPPQFSLAVEDPRAYLSAGVFLCMGALFALVGKTTGPSSKESPLNTRKVSTLAVVSSQLRFQGGKSLIVWGGDPSIPTPTWPGAAP